jgi:hypothetical protein
VGLHPSISVSELIGKIKSNSSRFYHEKLETNHFFAWQDKKNIIKNTHSKKNIKCRSYAAQWDGMCIITRRLRTWLQKYRRYAPDLCLEKYF